MIQKNLLENWSDISFLTGTVECRSDHENKYTCKDYEY